MTYSCFSIVSVVIPEDIVRPCRKLIGPFTKDEYLKYLTLQNGKRQNHVFAALNTDIPARIHPEQAPELGKKKKKKAKAPSSDEDEVDVEDINVENEDSDENKEND